MFTKRRISIFLCVLRKTKRITMLNNIFSFCYRNVSLSPVAMYLNLFLAVFSAFALPRMCHGVSADQCPAQEPIYWKALKGYTFKTLMSSSPFECLYHCHYDFRCQSYNYVIKDDICEMNNRTKDAKPEQFVSDLNRFYMKRGAHRGKANFVIYANYIAVVWVTIFKVTHTTVVSSQLLSVPLPRYLLSHARKSKQMKQERRSVVIHGWIPLDLERLSWLTVT